MLNARQSIRHVTTSRPSKPGKPPRSRAAGKPMKRIFSIMNQSYTGAIIGPVGFGSGFKTTVPEIHEKARTVRRRIFLQKKRKSNLSPAARAAARRKYKMGLIKPPPGRGQATRTIHYPPRPFMVPAMLKDKAKYPQLWKDAIR